MHGMVANPFILLMLAGFSQYFCVEGSDVQRVVKRRCLDPGYNHTIYDYALQDLVTNRTVPLSIYQGKQEPANNATEIYNGIRHVRPGNGFVPNFKLFKKIEVNGKNEHPLYTFLKSVCPSTRDGFGTLQELYWFPLKNWDVRWNFEKFLIDPWGKPYMRYDPSSEPISRITMDIEAFTHSEL